MCAESGQAPGQICPGTVLPGVIDFCAWRRTGDRHAAVAAAEVVVTRQPRPANCPVIVPPPMIMSFFFFVFIVEMVTA